MRSLLIWAGLLSIAAVQAPLPDEALWDEIEALRSDPVDSKRLAADAWFALAKTRRAELLERLALYQTVYPGGAHRNEAISLELETLFEAASLSDNEFPPFERRVRELLVNPPNRHAIHEAAYWEIFVTRFHHGGATSRPTTASVLIADDAMESAAAAYIEKHPESRYTPRLATLLFERAEQTGDRSAMTRLAELLRIHHTSDVLTASLAGRLRLLQIRGSPFHMQWTESTGAAVDTRAWRGAPILVVVWDPEESGSRGTVRAIEEFRLSNQDLRVIGVPLCADTASLTDICSGLGIGWVQYWDIRAHAHPFVREWGIRNVPFYLGIDREGRLLRYASGSGAWGPIARELLSR